MMKYVWSSVMLMVCLGLASMAGAHVPYFEDEDFTTDAPFVVRNSVEQSIAVYSWLGPEADDLDVYEFELEEPARVYVETLVPVCDVYEDLFPFFAIVGPGFPAPANAGLLPFDVPEGDGVVILPQYPPQGERESFYEPFGNKSYYQGPRFDEIVDTPGVYRIYVWDPDFLGGDYVAVIGNEEIWRARDILRALIYTPLIRNGRELHSEDCITVGDE